MRSPSTVNSMFPSVTSWSPVAVTTMSASRASPESRRMPVSVNVSMVSVTTDAAPARIAAKKSPSGTRHKR